MRLLAFLFCGTLVAVGAVGLFSPKRLIEFARRFQSAQGLFLAAAIRVAFGGALVLVADGSRTPSFVHGLGIFLVVAGVVTPLVGVARYVRILDWWAGRGDASMRAWAVFALAFGLVLAYLLAPIVRTA